MLVLDEPTWRSRAEAHRERMRRWTGPYRERKARRERHPVEDFLFVYYSHSLARLEQWHPGLGVALRGADEFRDHPGYVVDGDLVRLDPAALPDRLSRTAEFVRALVTATAQRAPLLSCFGLHEWAMVYRSDALRHDPVPLRLGAAGTDAVVESLPLRCTHHDAYRFFTPAAVPHNAGVPTREDQVVNDQPGCLHATMDLYKWAFKLSPATPSELLAECFALAADVRALDMRASPYDLADLGYPPVPIETPTGRAEYARRQVAFAQRAAPLREGLVAVLSQ